MDLLRSCYRVSMRLQDGADPVLVQWAFADKGADLIGVSTPFGSANWNLGEPLRFDSYLGEQSSSRPWRNGTKPNGLVGKRLCFPLEWFNLGVPAGETIQQQLDKGGVPLCCQETFCGSGGAIISGTGQLPKIATPCCPGKEMPRTFHLRLDSPLCPCYDGVQQRYDYNDVAGQWECSTDLCGLGFFGRLRCSAPSTWLFDATWVGHGIIGPLAVTLPCTSNWPTGSTSWSWPVPDPECAEDGFTVATFLGPG